MALPADTVWRVRTSGSDTLCGGGFSVSNKGATGVDHSQQNAANKVFAGTLSGSSTTTLTDSANGFTNAMLGNLIQITGQGFYCITGFTDAGHVVVDRALGAFASTNGYEGGGLATIAVANANAVALNIISIQSGYSAAITASIVAVSDVTYLGEAPTRPIITCATNGVILFNVSGRGNVVLDSLNLRHTAATRGQGIAPQTSNAGPIFVRNCIFDGCLRAIEGDNQTLFQITGLAMDGCEVKNCTGDRALSSNGSPWHITNSYIHNNAGEGLRIYAVATGDTILQNCVFANNIGYGVDQLTGTGNFHVQNCSFVNNSNSGIRTGPTAGNPTLNVVNCIFYNNTNYGLEMVGSIGNGAAYVVDYNACGANTVAPYKTFRTGPHDITLTGSPFVSASDFGLNSTAGAGAACKGAARPVLGASANAAGDLGAIASGGGGSGGGTSVATLIFGSPVIASVGRAAMSVRSGQTVTIEFTTSSPTSQAAVNADALPTAVLVVNGVDNAATVLITNIDTGRYKASVTLPTLAIGDVVEMVATATVAAVLGKAVVWRDTKDFLVDANGRGDWALVGDYTTARAAKLDNLDATVSSRLAASAYTTAPTPAAIADAVLSRDVANVEATAPEHSLAFVVLASTESNTTAHTGKLTVFRSDGTTEFVQKSLTSDALAAAITGVS